MRINLSLKKARVGDIFTSRLFVYDVTLSNFHGDKCSTMRTFGVKHIFYALMIDNSFCVFTTKKRRNGRKFTFCQLFEIALVWQDFHINDGVISTKDIIHILNLVSFNSSKIKNLKIISKMNLGKLIGFLYVLVILALICHFASASPKQYDGSNNNNNADR